MNTLSQNIYFELLNGQRVHAVLRFEAPYGSVRNDDVQLLYSRAGSDELICYESSTLRKRTPQQAVEIALRFAEQEAIRTSSKVIRIRIERGPFFNFNDALTLISVGVELVGVDCGK